MNLRLEYPDGTKADVDVFANNLAWARERAAEITLATRGPFGFIDWRGAVGFVDCKPAEERQRGAAA